MPFPPGRTFIGLSYTLSTPTLAAGSSYRDVDWPLVNLVDGTARTSWRAGSTTGALLFDLGSPRPCNFFCCFGHNFDATQVVSIQMSGGGSLSRGCGVKQPSFWLDLRALNGQPTTARYLQFAWVGNSRPPTIGEIAIGLASEFTGIIEGEPREQLSAPQLRNYLEYGTLITSATGTVMRSMDLTLSMTAAERVLLAAIEAQAAADGPVYIGRGQHVIVVPSTHRNDAWYVEWPKTIEVEHPQSDRIVRAPLALVEEVFGVR
jgi:hypothetical protein